MSEVLGLNIQEWDLTVSAAQLLVLVGILWVVKGRRRGD